MLPRLNVPLPPGPFPFPLLVSLVKRRPLALGRLEDEHDCAAELEAAHFLAALEGVAAEEGGCGFVAVWGRGRLAWVSGDVVRGGKSLEDGEGGGDWGVGSGKWGKGTGKKLT